MKEDDKVYFDLERKPLESERREKRKQIGRAIGRFFSYLFVLFTGVVLGYYLVSTLHPTYKPNLNNTIGEIEYLMKNIWLYSQQDGDLSSDLEERALHGMTTYDYDPYTQYMSSDEMKEFASSINRDYVGIGVQYSSQTGVPIIVRVFKNSPAERAGMLAGDIIRSVDGITMNDDNMEELVDMVRGESGTEVRIGVQRGSEFIELSIIREAISSTVYAIKEDDYVYMEIDSFGESTAADIESYLNDYEDIRQLIVDLRDDSGGYQTAVRDCLRLFIGSGKPYLRQIDAYGNEQVDYTGSGKTFENFDKIVIITNANTASAAEVFALVMREELDNVTLVGETTYGKGVIQTNHYLKDGGVLKLTSFFWYSPQGTTIDDVGVDPDIEVFMPDIYYEYYYAMENDETYEYDSVSEAVRISEVALDYLDYDVKRCDGYFDESFGEALEAFKQDNGLPVNQILDAETFDAIVARARYELSNNEQKDSQLMKAIEVLHEN